MSSFALRIAVSLLSFCPAVATLAQTPAGLDDAGFERLLDDHWDWTMGNAPTFASSLGDRRFDDRWTDVSPAAFERRHREKQAFLARLDDIDNARLSESNRLNYELFRRELENDLAEHEFRQWLIPLSQRGGIQTSSQLAERLRLHSADDFENWNTRLRRFGTYMDQTIELMRTGMREGRVPPSILMDRLPDQVRAQIVAAPTDSDFYAPLLSLPETIDAERAAALRTGAREAIGDVVVPAFERLLVFLETEYLPACRDSIGIADQPDGKRYYETRARRFTTTSMTPEEIHRIGLAEVARIRAEMQRIITELGFDGDFAAFLHFLRTDPQFYYDTPEELLTAYLATSKRIDPELVKLFGKLPRTPYGVRPIPAAIAPDTTTAYDSPPAADGSRAGYYYVNLFRPEVRPKYEIEVLTVHEAMPGHHLQIALAQELGDVPAFRRFLGFTAFVEGWGLYSESLGADLGLYEDPYSRFGQLTYEMWRAVRLVVDTGMHYKGWSRERAIEFFKTNAAKTEADIVNEIDRYISWPGQALAYKIGELKIKALRARAEDRLGARFDVRRFHDEILSRGALPLDLLERYFERWLASEMRRD
jgi:prolyl oligopeptidase